MLPSKMAFMMMSQEQQDEWYCKEFFEWFIEDCAQKGYHVKRTYNRYLTSFAQPYFYIEECPGWIFGIWLYVNFKLEQIEGTFFTAYEDTCDKFKPSRVQYKTTSICVTFEDLAKRNDKYFAPCNTCIQKILNCIHKHPLKAFFIDYTGCDYNVDDYSILKQIFTYLEYKIGKAKTEVVRERLDGYVLTYVEEEIIPCLEEEGYKVTLIDNGEDTLPRYEIACDIEGTELEHDINTGCYDLFSDDQIEEKKNWDFLMSRCNKMADFWGVWWHQPVDPFIIVYKKSDFEEDINA